MIKKVFKGGSQEVDDENVVEALLAEIVDIRDSGYRRVNS